MRHSFLLLFGFLLWLVSVSLVHAFETRARAGAIFDVATQTYLYEKNADTPLPPASMSKLMTLLMVFEALEEGRITLETEIGISAKASKMEGSKMFIRQGARIRVEDLLRGVIVQSGNDACIALAEGLAGTEEAFAEKMNERAKELGLTNSHFKNASGWPDPEHVMSMRDLVTLSAYIIENYAEYYTMFAEKSFTWENITQRNRNPLLSFDVGADGLKTGYTRNAGYGLVGSALQNGRRVIFAITGMPSRQVRAEEGERILAHAFRQFSVRKIFQPNSVIATPKVWMGEKSHVGAFVKEPITLLVPAGKLKALRAEFHYTYPLEAPIKKGQEIGKAVVYLPGAEKRTTPVFALNAVKRGGIIMRLRTAYQKFFSLSDAENQF